MKPVTVITHPNIALIKYWGKRDEVLHLPTKSSLSVGLGSLATQTTIASTSELIDQIIINGETATPRIAQPILDFLTLFKNMYNINQAIAITTSNNFPTAAGLASSASGFAALAIALNTFFDLQLSRAKLSELARRGSGSACRSLFGGFVIWNQGKQTDGHDSIAEQLFTANHWPEFRIIVVVVSGEPKKISSRLAMQSSVNTSPFYAQWLKESEQRLLKMQKALAEKDFGTVGQLAEDDCLGMHKTMHTSQPSITFWSPATQVIMQSVIELRTKHNVPCYFTIDAGPNVKILCLDNNVSSILEYIKTIPDVSYCITSKIARDPQ